MSNGINGEMHVLDKAKIPSTQPIKLSVIPFFIPIAGNKGAKIENPIPLNIFMKNSKLVVFIVLVI